jgi:uncharacterized RDD family membrane protein YckC
MTAVPEQGGEPARSGASFNLAAPSLYRRMACWLYEGMLLFAVVFVAGWLFSALGQMRNAMDSRRLLLQAFMFVVLGIYFAWFWSRGQTLAMKTWNISVVDTRGNPITQMRALLRYVFSWLWFLPPFIAMAPFHLNAVEMSVLWLGWVAVWALLSRFQAQHQFWHDVFAGTRLVSVAPLRK